MSLILLGTTALGARPPPSSAVGDEYYASWLASVEHLMSDAEYEVFVALDDGRELFIRWFWEVRAPNTGWHNPVRERWRSNFEEVNRQFGTLHSDRARAMLVAGKPDRVMVLAGCRGPLRDLEIWAFSPRQIDAQAGHGDAGDVTLVFYLTGDGEAEYYRHWSHDEGFAALVREPAGRKPWTRERLLEFAGAKNCFDFLPGEAENFAAALSDALDETELLERIHPSIPGPGWLALFATELASRSRTAGPKRVAPPAEISFPGSYEGATLVRGRIAVPVAEVGRSEGGQLFDDLVVEGDVWADGRMIDVFRHVSHVRGGEPGTAVLLDFYRLLEPGTYTLSLWLQDGGGRGLLQEVRGVVVPLVEKKVGSPPGGQALAELTGDRVEVMTAYPSVKLLAPGPDLVVGEVEITAVTTGDSIARVDFFLDDEAAASDTEPPFSAELDLGRTPRRHTVTAVAVDPKGSQLARDEIVLNGGPHRFAIRLVEPAPGSGGQRAQAVVEVPEQESLDRVELYLDDTPLATLYQPPFMHTLPRAETGRAVFVRAVAHLGSGLAIEDTVLLHSADFSEEIDVRLVELFTSVVDPQGRFVGGLTAERFRVLEDGVEQTLTRFDTLDQLPIRVALLMDISVSMVRLQEMATLSALRFFETVLRPKDRAALLTFHHEIRLLVPFTNDLERLRHGLSSLTLELWTRLWDGVIFTGHYFGGLEGKRALVVLSDSREVGSRFGFKQVLEHVLRSGVAVYPIIIAGQEDPLERARLKRLAAESGGTFFSIERGEELDAVYSQLESELRSQYLLVYQAPDTSARDKFRTVEVEVLPPSDPEPPGQILRARTIHGYYP
ncbi:MAG: VWA domain-containing protein [bacterium]|nr:VWA domain-containing protein [bacterium]